MVKTSKGGMQATDPKPFSQGKFCKTAVGSERISWMGFSCKDWAEFMFEMSLTGKDDLLDIILGGDWW